MNASESIGSASDAKTSNLVSSLETMFENSEKPSIAAARFTTSLTVNLVDLLTRSANVPRSGFASIAMTRSSRTCARAIPKRVEMVVLPTPPFRVRTGINLAPPSSTAPMRASIALRALTLGESPGFQSFKVR